MQYNPLIQGAGPPTSSLARLSCCLQLLPRLDAKYRSCGFQAIVVYLTMKSQIPWPSWLHPITDTRTSAKFDSKPSIYNVWNPQYQCPKGTSYKAVFPRRRKEDLCVVQACTATLFRLKTGYCKLHLHRFRLGLHQDGLCDACQTPETVAHFLLICPQYHAQRETLLANLYQIGVNVNTADILRNPEASRHVQQFVNETNRTLWRTDEPIMRHGAKRPVMSKRQPPPHHNSLCDGRSVSEWLRMEARILRFNQRWQTNLVFIIRRRGLLFLVDNEGCSSVFQVVFRGQNYILNFFNDTLHSESQDMVLPFIEVKRIEESMFSCTWLLQQMAAIVI